MSTVWSNIFIFSGLLILVTVFFLNPWSDSFQNKFLPRLENFYERVINYVLYKKRPLWFFLGTIGLLFFSFVILGLFTPKVLFFPENEPNYVNVFIQHPLELILKSRIKQRWKLNEF